MLILSCEHLEQADGSPGSIQVAELVEEGGVLRVDRDRPVQIRLEGQ
jgi:hypothetical protein